ncbi:MAG: glycosyltransferase [Succinivibrionaceae bacterium]|nr:glycosyltransferase [Succinivibrionaceae bacterium]MDY6376518.1 glycosyltransferase [Succinivibrionaceae bacterium]
MTPWQHYVIDGFRKGYGNGLNPPDSVFFPDGYLLEYPDVAESGEDPWRHYAGRGHDEGRDNGLHPSDNVFFPEGYLVMYPDVAKSGIDPWHHYVLFGKAEGRDNGLHPGKEVFFEAGYRAMYPDVGKSRVDPWHHYVLFGRNEGRDSGHHPGDAEFFAAGYLAGLYGNSGSGKTKVREYPYQKRPLDIDLTDVDLSERMKFPDAGDPVVSIVIPCYNHFDVTMRCLRSVLKNTRDVSYEVIIADDHSKDETVNIGKYASNVRYIANARENGFVNNCNSGASIAKGKYLYFLNNDTEVQPGYLKPLTDLIESDPGIGIVGSMLIFADGTLQESGGQIFEDSRGSNVGRGMKNIDDVTVNYVRDTDYISGAALMIRSDLFRELGGFDQVYSPAYCEDSDLCLRVWYWKQMRVVIQPKSRVVHFEGQSFPSAKKEALIQRNNQTLFKRFFTELSAHHCCAEHNSFVFKDHASHKKQMLVVDWKILSTSFDTGSRVTFQYMRLFREMGMNVKYYPMDVLLEKHEFLEDLEQIGVEVIFEEFASYIARNGKYFDYVFVNRPNVTQRYLRQLRFFTRAQIIYQGHDLHYLRRYRENLAIKKPDAEEIMLKERKEEFDVIRYCDLPCFVSQDEVDLVNKAMPFSHCIKLPIFLFDVRNMTKVYKAAERKDICFVAGFQHSPNIDGACWFVNKVWPAVKKKIPDLKIYIIGSKPSAEVRALASDSVIVTGYVTDEELEDYYSKVRMAVIPLNFGAGVKGKTVEAVYNKVPVLTTKIGAEGIDNSMGVLTVENDAESFSAKLIEMYNNEKELQRISDMSAEFIRSQFTKEKAIEIFDRYLVK